MIPGPVKAELKAAVLYLPAEPTTRREMRFSKCRAVHAAVAGGADRGELIERGAHTVHIDAQVCDHELLPCKKQATACVYLLMIVSVYMFVAGCAAWDEHDFRQPDVGQWISR